MGLFDRFRRGEVSLTGNSSKRKNKNSNKVKTLTPEQRKTRAKNLARRRRKVADEDKPTSKMLAVPTPDKGMSSAATATATRSDAKKARESMSGPNARPASKLAGPPTAPKSDLKSSGTTAASKGDRRTPTAAIVGEKSTGASGAKDNPKTVGKAKKRGSDTFIGKDGKKKAAVTKEELKASGLSLRDYLNKQRGLTRKKPVKKSMGGKVKAYSSGGSVRGGGKARKTNSCTMVTMKGS